MRCCNWSQRRRDTRIAVLVPGGQLALRPALGATVSGRVPRSRRGGQVLGGGAGRGRWTKRTGRCASTTDLRQPAATSAGQRRGMHGRAQRPVSPDSPTAVGRVSAGIERGKRPIRLAGPRDQCVATTLTMAYQAARLQPFTLADAQSIEAFARACPIYGARLSELFTPRTADGGIVRLVGCRSAPGRVAGSDDATCLPQLRRPPLPGRDHQLFRVALFPIPAEPAPPGPTAGRTRRQREP